jgi:hypothetical protein
MGWQQYFNYFAAGQFLLEIFAHIKNLICGQIKPVRLKNIFL